jgi:hypothetical protein
MAEDAAVKTMVGSSPTPDLGQMMAQRSSVLKPYEESRTKARKQEQEFGAEKQAFEQAQKAKGLQVEKEAIGAQRTSVEEAYKPLEILEKNIQDTTFIPSEATASDLAALYGLIGVVGWGIGAGGKGDAMQAMSAMNGMLEGYQKGRQDIYKKEKEVFDLSVRNLRERARVVAEGAKRIAELSALDRDAAKVEQAMLVAQESATFYKDNAAKFGYAKASQDADDLLKAADKMFFQQFELASKQAKSTGRPQLVTGKDGTVYSVDADANATPVQTSEGKTIQKQVKPVGGGGGVGGGKAKTIAGQNALTFASRVYGNIENAAADLENILSLPATSQSPVFAGMIGVDRDTAFRSLTSLVAREITSKEERAFEQITNSLDAALARLEGQGLATGGTQAAIRSFSSLKPRAGDAAINLALYLARVKQEIQTGVKVHEKMPGATPEQLVATTDVLKRIDTAVPFNVSDVLSVLRGNGRPIEARMEALIGTPSIVPSAVQNQPVQQVQPSTDIPRPKTQDEYNKIRKGTRYIDTDGIEKIKE